MEKSKPPLGQRLREKYRINILNPDNFQELSSFTISWLQVIMAISMVFALAFIIMLTLFAFTPINGYFTEKTQGIQQGEMRVLLRKLDSLERVTELNDQYTNSIRAAMAGEEYHENTEPNEPKPAEPVQDKDLFYVSSTDSALRKELEAEKYNIKLSKNAINSSIHFYPPVNGYVLDSFDQQREHYAVDIVAKQDEAVKATQDGVVIFSDYTVSTGYVIMVQHSNDFVSVYKHNAVLLKSVGSFVRAGETIGIVGNSGELTSGRHLHFELWQKGQALNPLEYIIF